VRASIVNVEPSRSTAWRREIEASSMNTSHCRVRPMTMLPVSGNGCVAETPSPITSKQ